MAKKIKRRRPRGFACAFCEKKRDQVEVLVVGNNGVHICDECIVAGIQFCVGRGVDVVSRAMDQLQQAMAELERAQEQE